MPRKLDEWIGKTPDTKVPRRVRVRIFEREGGKCWISGRKIRAGEPWELDHRIALVNGGEHRESNLFPALTVKHREKTAEDVAEKSKTYEVKAKHVLPRGPSKMRSAGFRPVERQRTASKGLSDKFPLARKASP